MSLKMESHSKWNGTQNGVSLKMEFHSNWNVTEIEMSLKLKCHSKWNYSLIGMSLKLECHNFFYIHIIHLSGQLKVLAFSVLQRGYRLTKLMCWTITVGHMDTNESPKPTSLVRPWQEQLSTETIISQNKFNMEKIRNEVNASNKQIQLFHW